MKTGVFECVQYHDHPAGPAVAVLRCGPDLVRVECYGHVFTRFRPGERYEVRVRPLPPRGGEGVRDDTEG